MTRKDDFFIGWRAELPSAGRRSFLAGSAALLGAAATSGAVLARSRDDPGSGVWDQGMQHTLQGRILPAPYPHLLTDDLGDAARTVYLVGGGKTALDLERDFFTGPARVTGTLIRRGAHAMLAVTEASPAATSPRTAPRATARERLGDVFLTGEILDAKCWFGAMRPAHGKTHKACAALCARGGLPLAFCPSGTCSGAADTPLFLDETGAAHPADIFPLAGDLVAIKGTRFRLGGQTQLHVARADIRRI